MNKVFDKIKNLFSKEKKEKTTAEIFEIMNKELADAEEAVGGNFFPKENISSSEQVHSKVLQLGSEYDFEQVYANYQKLKKEYNPEQYKQDEVKYKEYAELDARLEYAYGYFKQKFGISG